MTVYVVFHLDRCEEDSRPLAVFQTKENAETYIESVRPIYPASYVHELEVQP